jgi:myosin heavy subunit
MSTTHNDINSYDDVDPNANDASSKLLAERTKAELQVMARNQSASMQLQSDKIDKLHSEIDKFYNKLLSLEFTVHNFSNRTPPSTSGKLPETAKLTDANIKAFNDKIASLENQIQETVSKNIELSKFADKVKEQLASPSTIAANSDSENAYIEKVRTLEQIVNNTTQESQNTQKQISELQHRIQHLQSKIEEDFNRRNSGNMPKNFDEIATQTSKNVTTLQRIENTIGLDKAHLENKITQLNKNNKYNKLFLWSNVALWACMIPLGVKYLFFNKKNNEEVVVNSIPTISTAENTVNANNDTMSLSGIKAKQEELTNATTNATTNTTTIQENIDTTSPTPVDNAVSNNNNNNKTQVPVATETTTNNIENTYEEPTTNFDSRVSRRTIRKNRTTYRTPSKRVLRTENVYRAQKSARNFAITQKKHTASSTTNIQNEQNINNKTFNDTNNSTYNTNSKTNSKSLKGVYFGED